LSSRRSQCQESIINVDLHSHSTVSDGSLTPEALVRRALGNGVTMLALTDHDELGGIDEAIAAAGGSGLTVVPGVEISTSFCGESVHIVGLNIDHHNAALQTALAETRHGRAERAERIGEAFAAIGVPGVLNGARRFARNPQLVGRAHFARHLVSIGLAPDVPAVFQRYLVRGKPGFVEHRWADVDEAVRWIRAAGGVAVLAHPARYRLSSLQMEALFDHFVACGGEGVEVVSGSHSEEEVRRFGRVAEARGLLASRGSDFHADGESQADLGAGPALPSGLTPVWSRWSSVSVR